MGLGSLPEFIAKQSATSAAPLLLAGFGELLAQRAGVINVGIEGTMLMGAIAAYAGAVYAGTAAGAIPAALLAGVGFGAIFAVIVVWFRADQIVTGTAIDILALGASTTLWRVLQNYIAAGHPVPALFEPVAIPYLSQIPWVGGALFAQYFLFYVIVMVGMVLLLVMRYTRMGLVIRALGDAPDACDAAGIRVRLWRTGLLLFAGGASGLAGAYLSTMRNHSYQINMTNGRGFLVLALVIFGRWNVLGFAVGTLAFGAIDALQTYLAASPGATAQMPHQLFDMLPYAATLIALAIMSRSRTGPLFLGRAWPE